MAPGRHMRQIDQRPVGRSCQGEIGYWSPVCPRTQEGTHLLPEETRQVGWVRFQFDSVYFSPMVVICEEEDKGIAVKNMCTTKDAGLVDNFFERSPTDSSVDMRFRQQLLA